MLKESATGIRAPGCVGDKIVAKERKERGKAKEEKRGQWRGQKEAKTEGKGS